MKPIAQHYKNGWLIGWATATDAPFTARYLILSPPDGVARGGAWIDLPGKFSSQEAAEQAAIEAAKLAVDREIG